MMITNDWLLHENDYALAHLETYYQDILTRLQRDYPESHVVLCAKLNKTWGRRNSDDKKQLS